MKPTKDSMIFHLDENEVKMYEIMFNKKMSENFDWFKGSVFEDISFKKYSVNPDRNYFACSAEILVDKEWAKELFWMVFGDDAVSNFEQYTGLALGDIVDGDLSVKIQEIMRKIFSQVTGAIALHTSFSWMGLVFVEETEKDRLEESIRRILKEETDDLGPRTDLEKFVTKFISSRVDDIQKLDNFYGIAVDIYNGLYGKYCHVTFLMKKPFSGDDSDFINEKFNIYTIKKQILRMLPNLELGFSTSLTTVENYMETKSYYDDRKGDNS